MSSVERIQNSSISTSNDFNKIYRNIISNKEKKTGPNLFKKVRLQALKVWSYASKIIALGSVPLKALAASSRSICYKGIDFSKHLKTATVALKMLSVVNLTFDAFELKKLTKKFYNSVKISDKEGIALSSLSLSTLALGIFDSVGTIVNTTLALASVPVVHFFSVITMPIGFTLIGLGSISKSIQIYKSYSFKKSIQKEISTKNPEELKDALKNFIEKNLTLTDKEFSSLMELVENKDSEAPKEIQRTVALKRAALLRAAPKAVVKELETLMNIVSSIGERETFNEQELNQITQKLKAIEFHLNKKIFVNAVHLFSNLLSTVAMILFALQVTAPAAFALVAISILVKICIQLFEDYYKYSPPTDASDSALNSAMLSSHITTPSPTFIPFSLPLSASPPNSTILSSLANNRLPFSASMPNLPTSKLD